MPETNRTLASRLIDAFELRQFLRARDVFFAASIVTLAVSSFLFAPRPTNELQSFWRLIVLDVAGPAHVVKNIDSWEFEHDAAHPADLLTPEHHHWQSRPLAIGLGWFLAQPYRALGVPTIPAMTPAEGRIVVKKAPFPDAYNATSPEYAGFITLNWLILVFAVMLLKIVMRARSYMEPKVFLPMSMLVVNGVTKAFFWTPHVQIFSVVLGVGTLAILRPLSSRVDRLRPRDAALIGLLVGIAALAYGAFAVTAGSAILCILVSDSGPRNDSKRKLFLCLSLIAAFFAPFALWAGFVTMRTGAFYSAETQRYHEFVWIPQSLAVGPRRLAALLALHLSTYGRFLVQATTAVAALIAATVVFFFRETLGNPAWKGNVDTRRAVLFYIAANVAFYSLMGFNAERLAWTVVPALLVILGLQIGLIHNALTGIRKRWFGAGVYAIAIGYAVWVVMRAGPFA